MTMTIPVKLSAAPRHDRMRGVGFLSGSSLKVGTDAAESSATDATMAMDRIMAAPEHTLARMAACCGPPSSARVRINPAIKPVTSPSSTSRMWRRRSRKRTWRYVLPSVSSIFCCLQRFWRRADTEARIRRKQAGKRRPVADRSIFEGWCRSM